MFFTRKKLISQTDFLKGFTDYHCHLLPGVDDGSKTIEESITILKQYEKLGIKEVWLTPHVMVDMPNTTDDLKQRFEKFQKTVREENINIELHLAAEYMMDEGFDERLKNKDLLTHTFHNQILVETSYVSPPMNLEGVLSSIMSAGYFPLLAHPERYIYMNDKMYYRLHEMGVRFQLNLGSLSGGYGKDVKKKAIKMLKKNWYFCCGTDCHRMSYLDNALRAEAVKELMQLN